MNIDSKKITILHMRCSNYMGGPETSLVGWLKFIDRQRFDPQVLFFEERLGLHHRSLEVFAENGVPVEMVPWGPRRDLRGAIRTLTEKARTAPNPIFHSHDVRSDVVCLIAGRIAGAPVVVSNHAWHAVGLKRRLFEAARGFWLRYADLVVNVSEDTHIETLRRGVRPERSLALYSGLDLTPYQNPLPRAAAKQRIGIAEDDIVIGDVARMWPEKALHTLVEAAARLAPKYPNLKIVLVGDGPLMPALEAQVQALGVQDTVRFPGFRKDLVEVMAAFDIFALPSLAEGTPMVIYSAMALGLPIVASAVNGIAEILEHERTGLLITPADTDALVREIERLLSDPEFRQKLGAAAKKTMEEKYSAERATREFEALYDRLVARRGAAYGRR